MAQEATVLFAGCLAVAYLITYCFKKGFPLDAAGAAALAITGFGFGQAVLIMYLLIKEPAAYFGDLPNAKIYFFVASLMWIVGSVNSVAQKFKEVATANVD